MSPGTESSAKVLIIEDNPSNLELMTYLLTAFGHEVSSEVTGQAGMDTAQSHSFDVILCDIHLPDISGEEIAKTLKASARWRSAPLIAVTALAMMGDRDRLLAAGFDGYIPKPIDPEAFVGQVERFASKQGSAQRAAVINPTPPLTMPAGMQGTALVLDDLEQGRYFLRKLLESKGYRVEESSTVAEAYEIARAKRPDLIISDINLTNENGEEFLRMAKQDSDLRNIPVILVTASSHPSDEMFRRVRENGAAALLVRPFDPAYLFETIDSLMERKG